MKDVLASTQKKYKELKNEPSVAYAEWKQVENFVHVRRLGETEHERMTSQGEISMARDSMTRLAKN